MSDGPSYRRAAGVEITRLPDGYLIHSDFVAIQLSGPEGIEFVERVLLALDDARTVSDIAAQLPGYSRQSVASQLERLRAEGVLTAGAEQSPHAAAYDAVGGGAEWSARRLAEATILVAGLEGHGALLADFLARVGVGALRLIDPGPLHAHHFELAPLGAPDDIGRPRQDVVADALRRRYEGSSITTGPDQLDETSLEAACHGADILVGCFDRGMTSAHHWLNRAALRTGSPALFAELRATSCRVGPLVLPERSSCFMCYRMRSVAAREDFDRIMALEEHFDATRNANLIGRPLLPGGCLQAAAALGQEILRTLLRIDQPTLADRVVEQDFLTGAQRRHAVVRVPGCPACGQKKKRAESAPLSRILSDDAPRGDLADAIDTLVSEHTGVFTHLSQVVIDGAEPSRPFVFRVRISNHQYLSERDDDRAVCSGKGASPQRAAVSAVGEAIERYSAARWTPDDFVYARRSELVGESVDARALVLYHDSQYDSVPYARYTEDTVLGWMRGRSLTRGGTPWVPAIAAVMDYAVHDPQEFLFPITSNGLAAGSSLAEAVLGAIYEVLERDAFMLAWLHRWPGRSYDGSAHPDPEVRGLAEAYRRRGVTLHLLGVPTDHPVEVCVGLARQQGATGTAAAVGLGADLDPVVAARKAAFEVAQVRPGLRRRSRVEQARRVAELVEDPTRVESLEDHALLYTSPRFGSELDFLVGPSAPLLREESRAAREAARDSRTALRFVTDHFREAGQDVIYVDLSSADLRPMGFHCARAILPDYQPIWFGRKERRLGGSRLLELPRRLGRAGATSIDSLNPLPHPIA